MSYYHSSRYDQGHNWTPEITSYDLVPYQDPVSFSDYDSHNPISSTYDYYSAGYLSEVHEPRYIDQYHHAVGYANGYDGSYYSTRPEISYLAYNYVEPKLIAYEPVETGYVSYHTQYHISYSTKDPAPAPDLDPDSGFNEPEFEEYDPTPYGGGYDIVSTYGKPLPPSDETCYPHSSRKSNVPEPKDNAEPLLPVPIPEPRIEPDSKPKPMPVPVPEPQVEPEPMTEHVPLPVPVLVPEPEPEAEVEPEALEWKQEEESKTEEYTYPRYGYDYPWPEYDHGYDIGRGGGGYDYGYGKQIRVQVPPCEYNPEVVDLCESIFGDWPCLARIRRQQRQADNHDKGVADQGHNRHHDPWEGCANYIFGGGPIVGYNDQKDDGRHCDGGSSYYYRQQPSDVLDRHYDENSWIHKLNIFS